MLRGAFLPVAGLMAAVLLSGCFSTGAPADGGLAQARDAARSAAQADDAAGTVASASSTTIQGSGARVAALPQFRIGEVWTGSLATPSSRVSLQWRVAAVGELLNVSGQPMATDRLSLTAGKMSGTEWLRQSDLALVKIAWNQSKDSPQPYPAGLVTVFTQPCALQWPATAGDSWTSTCQQRSWLESSPTEVSSATQTTAWTVALGSDGVLRATGQGTVTPDGQPDAAQHFTQILSLGSACGLQRMERFDSLGGTESLSTTSC